MQFQISPDAFFQVNTAAAEVLYSTVKELATSKIQKPVIYGQYGNFYNTLAAITNSFMRLCH